MNKKLRMIASVAPLILVPLIKERSKIKDHPDVVKLNDNSKLLYGKAKGSVGAATTKVKYAGSVVADKTKGSAEFISEKYTDNRKKHQYKKEISEYEKKLKKEEKLLKKYAANVEKARDKRLKSKIKELDSDLPTSEEKQNKMGVQDKNKKLDVDRPTTTNVQELNEEKVIGTEYKDDYSHGALFLKHKTKLDPKSAALWKEKRERPGSRATEVDDSLFLKHRLRNDAHFESNGRKTGTGTNYVKSDAHLAFDDYKSSFTKK